MSSESAGPTPPIVAAESSPSSNAKPHACVLCQQRKVRCDRLPTGCSNCTKARVECIYRAPLPPRRRKRKIPETDLLVRLKHYEDLLRNMGVELESESVREQGGASHAPPKRDVDMVTAGLTAVNLRETVESSPKEEPTRDLPPGMEYGQLVGKGTNTRYLENRLWTTVTAELQDPTDVLHESSEDEDQHELDQYGTGGIYFDPADLILRNRRSSINLQGLHPPAVHIFKLWQIFLDNVNPLSKIVHAPSTQQLVLEASADLGNISKATEALLFAIYASALGSTTPEECQQYFGESKASLAAKFRFGAQQALINAGLLKTSDLRVLQAFELFIISILTSYSPGVLWILSGVCIRIAQKMGLHRDGAALGLNVFEVEMRRRLWWQLLVLDGRIAELCGSGSYVHLWDTVKPLNVNDSDLTPGMKEPPIEHSGPTEMMFVAMRNEVGEWLRQSAPASTFDGAWNSITSPKIPLSEKLESIVGLEATLRRKILQYCDPSIPLHFLTLSIAKASVSRMRFLAHISQQRGPLRESMTQQQRDEILSLCIEQVEHINAMQSSKAWPRFSWLLYSHFQWLPFIFVLNELGRTVAGELAEKLWNYVEQVFEMKPELLSQPKQPLYLAVDNLALQAWDAYEARNGVRAYGDRGGPPQFIMALRAKRGLSSSAPSDSSSSAGSPHGFTSAYASALPQETPKLGSVRGIRFENMMPTSDTRQTGLSDSRFLGSEPTFGQSFEDNPMDWERWNDFIKTFQMESMSGFHENYPGQY